MRKILITVVLIATLGVCLVPIGVSADVSDPVGTSASTFYLDTSTGGEVLVNLGIENVTDHPVVVKVENWYNYTYPSSDQSWIDPEWCVEIEPNEATLPVGGQMIANILYDIPEDAEEIKYITWIRVDVAGWQKPITVIIRKGAASEAVEFSVYPAYYRLLADTYGAHVTVGSYHGENQLTVKNKAKNELSAYALIEDRGEPLILDEDSSIKRYVYEGTTTRAKANRLIDTGADFIGTWVDEGWKVTNLDTGATGYVTGVSSDTELVLDGNIMNVSGSRYKLEEVGTTYENISLTEAQAWFSTSYTETDPLLVSGKSEKKLIWSLDIPNDVENGHYVLAMRVKALDYSQNTVKVNYVVWVLVDVYRTPRSGVDWQVVVLGILGASLFAVIVGPPAVRRIRKYTQSEKE